MQKLTAAFVAAGLITIHGTAFALSKSNPPPASQSPAPAVASTPAPHDSEIGRGYTLGFDKAYAITSTSVTPTGRPAAGLMVSRQGVVQPGDSLGFSVTKPLPPPQGQAPELTPGGSETDFSIIYAAPLDPTTTGIVSLAARQDADNLPGQHDVAAMVRVRHSF